jgi:hypothetical protein
LLQEIQAQVSAWQAELQQIQRQLQNLYLEGPIVNGWLETYSASESAKTAEPSPTGHAPDQTAAAFRHADMACLETYVDQLAHMTPPVETDPSKLPAVQAACDLNPAGYRLCGLNESGQLWFRHCPPDQVVGISLAIARYQRLSQMLQRKDQLETQLSQLAQTLIGLHSEMGR